MHLYHKLGRLNACHAFLQPELEISLLMTVVLTVTGRLKTNTAIRAIQVRKAIEKLGPAYIKVAQAISTRVDVLDANYLIEIERLQDRVPPFPTPAALPVMTEGMSSK